MKHSTTCEPVETEESEGVVTPRAASRRVLIVEDERRLREMLHASVSEMGLQPTAAATGEIALKLVQLQPFALALVDLNLPGISGMDLCERLHQQKPDMQLIILTGFGDLDSAKRAIRLQVVDFLTKPCGMDDLENALNRARLRWLERWSVQAPVVRDPIPVAPAPVPVDSQTQRSMDAMERELILAALERHKGNRELAASELGISVRKLYYRLRRYQQPASGITNLR